MPMKIDLTVAWYIIHEDRVLLIHHAKLDRRLPVGWHIDENETPDHALLREIKEEIGIDVELLGQSDMPLEWNVKYNWAIPFYTNVHSVWDHDHYALFYVCIAVHPEHIHINNELKNFARFTREDLQQERVPIDVRNQALKAFEICNQ